ncbi:carbohydrate-binding module family 32 [Patellaria atrata CBS 101060]|uniref:Carbohydrate-binding module family 32 n=1 Tax=Patellaria atrata CBS 101060 TaxID=1346257 RepID=A0A9P4SEL8_9PEZI|nr:carbohydrate-binding module family 32 [Patellaria atrata CBS 101060]
MSYLIRVLAICLAVRLSSVDAWEHGAGPAPNNGAARQFIVFDPTVAGNPAVAQAVPLDRTGWTATADSSQSGNAASSVLDGDTGTIWHTAYDPTVAQLPHNIVIDMKAAKWINGVTIMPRQDGNNGNIGQHTIEVSQDGTNWGSPVATGTYLNDKSLKTTIFGNRLARYVRITARTEAQSDANQWTSAAEINILAGPDPILPPGQWSGTIDFPIVPAAAAVVPRTGKVLAWSAWAATQFGGSPGGYTLTATYDPATGVVSQRRVSNTAHDMFCPGISMDFNGRPVVTGGNDAAKTSIYDPIADTWTSGSNMKISRGYQSSTTLSDGRIFTIGGSWSGGNGGKNGEVYNPSSNTWTLLRSATVANMLTKDRGGVYRADNHAWLFGWKNGFVFQAGPSINMNWYGTSGSGSVKLSGPRASDVDAMNGNAVMYDAVAGKILTMGGGQHYQAAPGIPNTHVITINNPNASATVTKVANMAYARAFGNAVVLPDGKVFVSGGQGWAEPFTDNTAVYYPELWDPATQTWTVMAPNAVPRTYHSIGLLLNDATVLIGGGGLCGNCPTNHFDAEIWSPPYLFNADGSRATRPRITAVTPTTSGNAEVAVGGTLTVRTDSAVSKFSLVRMGSATHTVNTDHRRVPLTGTRTTTNQYSVKLPTDAGVLLPGYWMLFVMNDRGTPSLGFTVKVKL